MLVEAVVLLAAIVGILLALSAFVFHMITRRSEGNPEKIEEAVDAACDVALEEINKTSQLVMDELNEKYNALLFVYQLMDEKQQGLNSENTGAADSQDNLDSQDNQENRDNRMEGRLSGQVDELAEIFNTSAANADAAGLGVDISIGDELDVSPIAESGAETKDGSSGSEMGTETVISSGVKGSDMSSGASSDLSSSVSSEANSETNSEMRSQAGTTYDSAAESGSDAPKIMAHPKYNEIKEMQSQGLGISEIARQLGMGKGEIDLIIGLSGR